MSRLFNGTNYIHTPASAVYNSLSAATLACWVYITGTLSSTGQIYSFLSKDPTNTYSTSFALVDNAAQGDDLLGIITPSSGGQGSSDSGPTSLTGSWNHLAMTFDFAGDKKTHLFLNGVETTYPITHIAAGGSSPIDDSGDGWYFGDDTFEEGIVGYMAEVAIWNTVLSGVQIAAVAASTSGVASIATANLVGYWHLCGLSSPEPDASGNGNDGVLAFEAGGSLPTQGPNSPGYSSCSGTPTPPAGQNLITTNEASIDAFRAPFMGTLNVLGALIR